MSTTAISVRDVVFDYPERRALWGVSLDVLRGSISALVGPNGAGKTTLLRCMAGLQQPLSGTVHVLGSDVFEHRRECHRRLGYLSDFFGVYDALSVQRCLLYTALAQGLREDDATRAARRAAERVGIADRLDTLAGTLSRGLRQRLALGQALVHEPQIVLLDEPASGLDPGARHDLSLLLLELQRQGVTLVVSSHILSELEDYCTEMVVLNGGRVIDQRGVRSTDQRVSAYLLRVVTDAATALRALETMPGIRDPRLQPRGIAFECGEGPEFLANVLATLVKDGVAVSAFEERSTDMEELYLAALSSGGRKGDES